MKMSVLVPALSICILGATFAVAETADRHDHDGRPGGADMAAWHREMCADRYAHDVAKVAYLETRLAPTAAQRSAFENWKSAVLGAAKSQQDACQAHMHDFSHPPSVVDREAGEQMMLKSRLAALDAELPALRSLYDALTPEQKALLDRPHGDHGHGGWHGEDRGGPHGAPHGEDGGPHGDDGGPDH
jgi:hypothetical protein